MGEEGLVLGRDEGLDQALRHLAHGHEEPALLGIFGQQRTIGGMDAGHHRRFVGGELLVVRQVLLRAADYVEDPAGEAEKYNETNSDEPAQKTKHYAIGTHVLRAR